MAWFPWFLSPSIPLRHAAEMLLPKQGEALLSLLLLPGLPVHLRCGLRRRLLIERMSDCELGIPWCFTYPGIRVGPCSLTATRTSPRYLVASGHLSLAVGQ